MHGKLRAPRTEIGESCGSLQYMPSGVSMVVVSAGDRRCEAGVKPTVQGFGSPMVRLKSPCGNPVALFLGTPNDCCCAMYPGSSTISCSTAGLYTISTWLTVVMFASRIGRVGLIPLSRPDTSSAKPGKRCSTVRICGSLATSWSLIPARLCAQVRMAAVLWAWESSSGPLSLIRVRSRSDTRLASPLMVAVESSSDCRSNPAPLKARKVSSSRSLIFCFGMVSSSALR
ncbi:hypothetical protein C1Y40_05380 [Mycobacterium talmoniae]|uniref:Uncharacterized protein n=1 Tax=Mycobacterium talmoniae TaxID=1858794 RepID=A0A2S8BCT5_9MYCO|nr:hypothetical protein C1Y40_05380 [Mycobacterium talmoniae]